MQAVLNDLDSAPIDEPLRATLRLLRKVTLSHGAVTAEDIAPLIALGLDRAAIAQALEVAFAFNVINRLADAFDFEVGPDAAFDAGAKQLLGRGYRI